MSELVHASIANGRVHHRPHSGKDEQVGNLQSPGWTSKHAWSVKWGERKKEETKEETKEERRSDPELRRATWGCVSVLKKHFSKRRARPSARKFSENLHTQ